MAPGFGEVDTNAPDTARDLAARLRNTARHAGFVGVRELAAATGIGRSTISDALTARRVPTWPTIATLLRGCGVAPDGTWATAHEAARDAVEERKRAARGDGRGGGEAREEPPSAPPGPGTFSIRPPYGELPPRVRGREGVVELLRTRLAQGENRPQILYGMGGCGKTTLALDLARHARDRGYRVFWLSASTSDRLVTGMREIARELGAAPEAVEAAWSGRTSATDLVWHALDTAEQPWLLVIDNADQPAWLAAANGVPGDGTGWLRSGRAGMTVVTSRVGSPGVWGQEADTHRVEVLASADGRDVLLDLAGAAGTPADALVLAERLDGLPLALKLAGSYLARSARGAGLLRHRGHRPDGRLRSFAAYTEALGEAGAGFLDQGGHWQPEDVDTEHLHRRLVGRTWEMSLDLLEEQQLPEARHLMRILSCGASVPFPVELLDPDVLQEVVGQPTGVDPEWDRADRALEALVDLGLIDVVDIEPHGATGAHEPIPCLVVHRLVLEANALRLGDRPSKERSAIWRAVARILEQGAVPAPEQPDNWTWWRLLAPHIVAALTAAPHVDESEGEDGETLPALLKAGLRTYTFYNFASLDGDDDLARLLLRRGVILSPTHPVRLSIRHRAALSLLGGEEELAEYEDVLAHQIACQGSDHPETLITRHNVVLSRRACGRTSEAEVEAALREVLADRRRVLGPNDPFTLITHDALAAPITSTNDAEGRDRAEHRAPIEREESLSPENHRFLPLNNRHRRAHALDAAERWSEAEAEYRSVLADLASSGGRETTLYRDLSRCLANNLTRQERYPDALAMIDGAPAWFDGSDEEHTPTTASALALRHERGDLLRRCDRAPDAVREMRAVLRERLRTVDPGDSRVLSERHTLAHVLDDLGRHGEAQDELRVAVDHYVEILGGRDEITRTATFCLAWMLHTHGDKGAALELYERVLEAETAELGADHADTLMTGFRRDQCRLDAGLLSAPDAAVAFERTLLALTPRLGDEHHWVHCVRSALATVREGEAVADPGPSAVG
ncbi:tetratricopeptide repeat protein [Embleya sp. NPDC020886]|uniref:tetratricopeptide repeat protein n=1 Tax=Embleya sp. NPDC020886 TaxID=3363980 RepID=UPI0037B6555A